RVTQQVLEYLHTPHDVDLPKSRQLLLASNKAKPQDLAEGSPDHLGEALDVAEVSNTNPVTAPANAVAEETPQTSGIVVPAAIRQREVSTVDPDAKPGAEIPNSQPGTPDRLPSTGTVVMEVEQGGMVVPSFAGKSVRGAIELAEESGLDLDAVGDGTALDQSPAPGMHVATG